MAAHKDCASLTCRSRQSASISFCGRARIFSRSRYEDKVFSPGLEDGTFSAGALGGGGAAGNGDEAAGEGGGVGGAFIGIATAAFFFKSSILAL